jgi:hypothetical protein
LTHVETRTWTDSDAVLCIKLTTVSLQKRDGGRRGRQEDVITDPTTEDDIRVYPPVAVDFPGGNGDFKYFALKWVNDSDMKWRAVSPTSPAYDKIVKVGRVAFKAILGGVGYGRSDVRIDENTASVLRSGAGRIRRAR